MFSMENNNQNSSGSNTGSGSGGDEYNTSNNARDSFNTFFDSMNRNLTNNNNNNNNSNEFLNPQMSTMGMESPYGQSINLNSNNNNNNNSNVNNISPSQYNVTPATPQQILMFNNNNNNNTNIIKSSSSSNNINIQPQQILSTHGSPVLSNASPLIGNTNLNNNNDNTNNINNLNTTNRTNNNGFPDRNPMLANLQQQRLMELQQQQQERMQSSMNSPITSNIMLNNRNNSNDTNNSPITTTSTINTSSNNYGNTNMLPINQSSNMTPQQRQHLQHLQQQKNILQSLSPSLQQRISVEVNNKQYELFMKSLIENSKRRNSPLQSIPEIQNKKVNLFYLSLMVTKNGGYEEVTRKQLWNQIANKLRIVDPQQLQIVYYNILLDYEKYMNTDEGRKESLAKKNFLQQFLQELLRKIQLENAQQQQQVMNSNQFNDINLQQNKLQNLSHTNQNIPFNNNISNNTNMSAAGSPNVIPTKMNPANISASNLAPNTPNVTASNLISVNSNPQMVQPTGSENISSEITTNKTTGKKGPKKPRKPRQKKKTKKELELEKKQKEEQELEQRKLLEAQKLQEKIALEQKIKQRYEMELAKLPKVYKRTFVRNYKPRERKIDHTNGYDINYISQIGEKIDSHKPIFLFAPELGTVNLHAISMSLQCNNLGEITTALNTLLVASADTQLKIALKQCPPLLNSLTKLAINLLDDLTHTKNSPNRIILRDKNLSFVSDYADQYDVEGYLNNIGTSFSEGNRSIDDTFNEYVKSKNVDLSDSKTDKVILVDSLTGCDIDQINVTERTMNIEVPSNSEIDPIILNKINCDSDKVAHKWALFTASIRSQYDIENLSLFIPSYMKALKDIKCETDSPFSKIHARGADDTSVLILDQLSTISMILRNVSFSDINSIIMSQNFFLKRYFSDLSWLLFTDSKKFRFHRKLLNFKKDTLITLCNISHHWKIESYTFTVTLILLILSFRISTENSEGKHNLTFDEYPLNMSNYQSYGVDTLAKLLSVEYPNRQYLKAVLLNKFNDKSVNINDDVKMAKKLILKYNENGDLCNDLIGYLFSVIPFQQLREDASLLKKLSPVISQVLTSLYHLLLFIIEENNNNRSKKDNIFLKWLTSDENLGINFRKLCELYQGLSSEKEENQSFYNNLNCKILRLLRLIISESAVDTASCQEIAESPYLLPSEAELFKNILNPSGDAIFANEMKLFLDLRNEILDKI